jgi:hypothetical protein
VWEAKEKEKSGPSISDPNMLCQWPLTYLVIICWVSFIARETIFLPPMLLSPHPYTSIPEKN